MPKTRNLDLTLYGATGFTGRQAAAYLRDHATPDLRWALAGRDEKKLAALKTDLQLPTDVEVAVAASQDGPALDRMAERTRVILTTAGPFALHGEPVVSACVKNQTDYVDITGETTWARDMIDRYHETAVSSATKIVHFCGFDSVPSDLGTLMVADELKRLGQACQQVKAFIATSGGLNGGTAASVLNIQRSGQGSRMRDPFLLNPDHTGTQSGDQRDPVTPAYDSDLGSWVGPFVMGPVNTRVVRRSAALFQQWHEGYGPNFCYQEYAEVGGPVPWLSASVLASSIAFYQVYSQVPGAAELTEVLAPKPGSGPSEREMDAGFFRCRFVGTGTDGSKVWALIEDRGDPGNRATVKMVCEAALALVGQRDDLPGGPNRGGVLTPATALGMPLVERLRRAGITIEVDRRSR